MLVHGNLNPVGKEVGCHDGKVLPSFLGISL